MYFICVVIYFMWTPERIATAAVEANWDLNKDKRLSYISNGSGNI